jgi:hypothetical protein
MGRDGLYGETVTFAHGVMQLKGLIVQGDGDVVSCRG